MLMDELGRHVDIVANDYVNHSQRILFRFILAESGIIIASEPQHRLFAEVLLIKGLFEEDTNKLVIASSNPEGWLKLFSLSYYGNYQFATDIHGPKCQYGRVGDTFPTLQRQNPN